MEGGGGRNMLSILELLPLCCEELDKEAWLIPFTEKSSIDCPVSCACLLCGGGEGKLATGKSAGRVPGLLCCCGKPTFSEGGVLEEEEEKESDDCLLCRLADNDEWC